MTRLRWRDPEAPADDRVTAVEVFFDVVFVFTLTQLTRTLEGDLALLILLASFVDGLPCTGSGWPGTW
jgi:low temperature requirement protein LtrA